MREDGDASEKPVDIAVLTRMKQFHAMNKLKKVALKVCSDHISFEFLASNEFLYISVVSLGYCRKSV